MNIITQSDIKKFVRLAKIGFKAGESKDLRIYTKATMLEGTEIPQKYYISMEFSFLAESSEIQEMIEDDAFDNETERLLNSIK